jgi:gliding motility-associated lipoprotein GldB
MNKGLLFILSILFFFGCEEQSKIAKEIAVIPVAINIIRFDVEFAQSSEDDLPILKEKYPMFFSPRVPDSVWINKMKDSSQKELAFEVEKTFPEDEILADQLRPLFQHIKYYFPRFRVPTTITLTNNIDYGNKVIAASDTLLIVSLDNYLGVEHHFYDTFKKYIKKNLKPSQLMPDIASEYASEYISKPSKNVLLDQMIYFGKELYLKDLWLPETSDAEKIGYTEEELLWAKDNEAYIWRYFVEKELLYSTDQKLIPRFIAPAPFSKFYLELDNETPGMLARFVGWQIVKAFMRNNNITPQQMLVYEPEKLFKSSKYKPKK